MSTRARLPPRVMPPAVLDLKNRLASADRRHAGRFALLVAIHLTAFGIFLWSEDAPTFSFFLKVNPGLVGKLALAVVLALPVMVLLWRAEPFRVRRGTALLGC